MTVILDYGMGNLRSVERACLALGHTPTVQSDLAGVTKLIIPGVGAFAAAMERIGPLAAEIRQFVQGGGPLLGICLGQQLLFEWSEENPAGGTERHAGLGLLAGGVRYFSKELGLKIPHMGWNTARFTGASEAPYFYFVHSLYTACDDPADVAAETDYGVRFASAVRRDNVQGTQFHPEKSGAPGLALLRSFLEC